MGIAKMWSVGGSLNRSDVFLLTVNFSDIGDEFFSSVGEVSANATYDYLKSAGDVKEAVVLQTCNRFEVYFYPGTFKIIAGLDDFLRGKISHYRILHGNETIRHLFEVSSGLGAMVTGEDEILGQVRDAWSKSKKAGMDGPAVGEIFSKAIEVGRLIRSSTSIGKVRRSISREAVDTFEEAGGSDPVLVVGAGSMGARLARILVERGHSVSVTNRTAVRSERLSKDVGASPVPFNVGDWSAFQSIFIAVKKDGLLIREEDMTLLSAKTIVDVSVPRVVQNGDGRRRVITMEDISERLDRLNMKRNDLAETARSIVNDEFSKYIAWRNDSRREEFLRKLYSYTDGVVQEQLAEILRRTKLDEGQRDIVEKGLLSQRSRILALIVQSLKENDDIWESGFMREIERMLDESAHARQL